MPVHTKNGNYNDNYPPMIMLIIISVHCSNSLKQDGFLLAVYVFIIHQLEKNHSEK